MQFTLVVCYADETGHPLAQTAWREPMSDPDIETEEEARNYAERIITNFNATLRPNERPRAILDVEFGDNNTHARHHWEKQNLITETGRGGRSYDVLKCTVCGVTGKRYGVDSIIQRDPEFKAKAFQYCDTAQERLKIRAEHRAEERRRRESEEEAAE